LTSLPFKGLTVNRKRYR